MLMRLLLFLQVQTAKAGTGEQSGVTGKDIELLIYGAIAGAVAGLIFAVLIQPLVDEPARRILVAILGARRIRTKRSLAGAWSSVWVKDGSPLSLQYEMKRIDIINVGNSIEGQFDWNRRTYKFSGTRITDDFVSGTYSDVQEGRVFHGVFQWLILPGENFMVGRWLGFGDKQDSVEGPWEWRRLPERKKDNLSILSDEGAPSPYPFERTSASLIETVAPTAAIDDHRA